MNIKQQIIDKLVADLSPIHLEVVNESQNHNVPPGSESHFKVTLVSDEFVDIRLLQRHKRVNQILAFELANAIHALALHTYTLDEWNKKVGKVPESPQCMGGSKR